MSRDIDNPTTRDCFTRAAASARFPRLPPAPALAPASAHAVLVQLNLGLGQRGQGSRLSITCALLSVTPRLSTFTAISGSGKPGEKSRTLALAGAAPGVP